MRTTAPSLSSLSSPSRRRLLDLPCAYRQHTLDGRRHGGPLGQGRSHRPTRSRKQQSSFSRASPRPGCRRSSAQTRSGPTSACRSSPCRLGPPAEAERPLGRPPRPPVDLVRRRPERRRVKKRAQVRPGPVQAGFLVVHRRTRPSLDRQLVLLGPRPRPDQRLRRGGTVYRPAAPPKQKRKLDVEVGGDKKRGRGASGSVVRRDDAKVDSDVGRAGGSAPLGLGPLRYKRKVPAQGTLSLAPVKGPAAAGGASSSASRVKVGLSRGTSASTVALVRPLSPSVFS